MHYPRARAWWEFWRIRLCAVCGMRWQCDEAKRARIRATARVQADATGAWSQVGRAGSLTRAGQARAQGRPR